MIQPQELRIGNFITSDGEIFVVDEIRNDYISAGALSIYSSGFHDDDFYVPLTEEWLLKFGFTYNHISWYIDISYFPAAEYKTLCVSLNQGILIRCGNIH